MVFDERWKLNRHISRKTPCETIVKKVGEGFVCRYCKRTFTQKGNMERHVKNTCQVFKNKSLLIENIAKEEIKEKKKTKNKTNKKIKKIEKIHNDTLKTVECMKQENEDLKKEVMDLKKQIAKLTETTGISYGTNMDGTVYIIQEREFIKSKEPVFKMGMTIRSIEKRMSGYPKGSKILMCSPVKNVKLTEKELKNEFEANFKQRRDIGLEYFEGDIDEMCKLFRVVCTANS